MTADNERAVEDVCQISRALGFMYCTRNELDELELAARGNLSEDAYSEAGRVQSTLDHLIERIRQIRDGLAEQHRISPATYREHEAQPWDS